MLDLDKQRADRATRRAEAAAHEANPDGEPIIFGGATIAYLPPELPFDVIRPLDRINDDIALLLGEALRLQQGGGAVDGAKLVLDLFSSNADLPKLLVQIVKDIAAALLTPEGVQAFLNASPSVNDFSALVGGIFTYYGASLGESWRSVDSSASEDQNSAPTSNGSTASITAASIDGQGPPDSSVLPTSST